MLMEDDKRFIRLTLADIDFGKGVRWDIYNGDRQLILRKGEVINTRAEAEAKIQKGWYRLIHVGNEDVQEPLVNSGERITRPRPKGGVSNDSNTSSPAESAPAPQKSKAVDLSLESSRIKIGDPIQLQSSVDQSRYVVRLIGYLKNRGLMVTQPEVHGELVMLREGQSFVGRFFSGQSAYAFSASVAKQTSVPFPHLHLTYPKEIRGMEVRKAARIDVDLISALEATDGGNLLPGKVVNLSLSGAGLRTKQPIADKGQTITLKFKISVLDIDSYLVLLAEVCSVSQSADESNMPYLYGLKFVHMDNMTQLSLAAFVYGRLQELQGH